MHIGVVLVTTAWFSCFVLGTDGCQTFEVGTEQLTEGEIDPTVHTPLTATDDVSLAQCIKTCHHVATCNTINYALDLKRCVYHSIMQPPITTTVSADTWQILNTTTINLPLTPDMCSPNTCTAGQTCMNLDIGPVCTDIVNV